MSQETSEQIDDITTFKHVSDDYYDSSSEVTKTTAEDENKITKETQKSIINPIDDTTSNAITTKKFEHITETIGKTVKTVTQAKGKAVTKAKNAKNSPPSDGEGEAAEETDNKADDDHKGDKSDVNSNTPSLQLVLLITVILISVSTLIDNY